MIITSTPGFNLSLFASLRLVIDRLVILGRGSPQLYSGAKARLALEAERKQSCGCSFRGISATQGHHHLIKKTSVGFEGSFQANVSLMYSGYTHGNFKLLDIGGHRQAKFWMSFQLKFSLSVYGHL